MEFRSRGSSLVPQEIMNISCNCKLKGKMYTHNNKKYIDIELSPETAKKIKNIHEKSLKFVKNEKIHDPLDDTYLRVKVPWKYNRVTCKTDEYFYDIKEGELIKVNIEFCGVWNIGDFSGVSWKLTLINKI